MKRARTAASIATTVMMAAASLAVPVAIGASSASAAAAPLFTCTNPATFDSTNQGFRNQSTTDGLTLRSDFGAATFVSGDGDPANGSVQVNDGDNGWQELVSPELDGTTYATDYSALNGGAITFSYKYKGSGTPGSEVTNPVYMAIQSGGDRIYYVFKDQVDTGNAWQKVTVPLDATKWLTGFDANTGPKGAAPSAGDFADFLKNVQEMSWSMEGSNSPGDQTLFDSLGCHAPKPPAALPKLFTCSNPSSFDSSNEDWRNQSVGLNGLTLNKAYGTATWVGSDGDPTPGSVSIADADATWQELVSPGFAGSYSADYASLIGNTVTFSYKYTNVAAPSSTVTNPVYMAIQSGGKRIYYIFRGQLPKDHNWHTVTVPMDPSKWLTGFHSNATGGGPDGAAPSTAKFASMLASVEEFAFSMEGSNNRGDLTYFDNLKCQKGLVSVPGTGTPSDPAVPADPKVPAGGEGVLPAGNGMGMVPIGGILLALAGFGGYAMRRATR